MTRAPLSAVAHAFSRHASVTQRFWLIAIVALAPMAIVSAMLWREAVADLRQFKSERAGITYAGAVWRIMHGAGQTGSIDEARVQVFSKASADYDRAFGTGETSAALQSRIASQAPPFDVAEAGLELMKGLGNASDLFVDDSPDAYNHIQVTLVDLPEAAAAIAQANAVLGHQLPPAHLSPGLAFGRVNFALERTVRQAADAILATDDLVSRNRIEEAVARLRSDNEQHKLTARAWFRERQALTAAGYPDARPQEADRLLLQHARVLQSAEALWTAVSQDLNRTLLERERARQAAAAAAVLAMALAISAIAGLIWALSRSVIRPWEALMDAVRAIGAGDVEARVPCQDFANEIGEAARALELFRGAIAERATLAEHLELERDVLEARVIARTSELDAARAAAMESEGLLVQALQSVRAGAWSFDPATRKIWSSQHVTEICGKPFLIEDFEDGIWNLVAEPQASQLRAAPPVHTTGLRGVGLDLRIIRPDGAERWVHNTAVAMADGRFVGLLMDVTERKTQEIELAEARRRAEDANTAKSRFIASMSHEIRTPLNGVLAMAAALERTALEADQSRMVGVMLASGRQLLAMLNDVLDAAKIEAGSLVLHDEPFDLAAKVEAVAALFREAARAKGLALSVTVAPDAAGLWRGDGLRVRQVLQNFVSNAVKFTHSGAIAVRASATPSGLRLEVADTGIGIGAEEAAHLFRRFAQADGSITRQYGGTGLGLAICRELAELMGGRVGVNTAPGQGATFWFEAPLVREAPTPALTPQHRALRILAAEDNPGNRMVLDTLLAQAGLAADFVENGVEAVEATRGAVYDLILMDLHMPAMDGVTAARAIRAGGALNADTPIVALTASAEPEALAACRNAGMSGHVAKPIEPGALYAAIQTALEGETLALETRAV